MTRRRFTVSIVVATVVVMIGFTVVGIWRLWQTGQLLYNQINMVRREIAAAQVALADKQLTPAVASLTTAHQTLQQAELTVQAFRPLAWLPIVGRQITTSQTLITVSQQTTAALLTIVTSGYDSAEIILNDQRSAQQLTDDDRRALLGQLFTIAPAIQGAQAQIDLAAIELASIPPDAWLIGPVRDAVNEAKAIVPQFQKLLNESLPLLQAVPYLAGYGQEKTYLLLFQNNTELRPTGGFWGTYGILKVADGKVISLTTNDIYQLDGPAEAYLKVEPPTPLKQYLNDRWYLRDANWSPDFPTAARQALWFYEQERGPEKIDGVIAFDPTIVTDLLNIIGDISYNDLVFHPENFVDLLQYEVEIGFVDRNTPQFARKQLVGSLTGIMIDRLLNVPLAEWPTVIGIVDKNIAERHIMFYDRDAAIQSLYAANGWAGTVQSTTGDSLMVIDANMGSLKTDRVVDKNISYVVTREGNNLVGEVTLRYDHQQTDRDYRTGRLRTYTRIYVPKGSEIISGSQRFDVSQELDKTVFGGLVDVYPGEEKVVTVRYRLPAVVSSLDDYQLFVQKQAGTAGHDLSIELHWGDVWPLWQTDLTVDRSFTAAW